MHLLLFGILHTMSRWNVYVPLDKKEELVRSPFPSDGIEEMPPFNPKIGPFTAPPVQNRDALNLSD